MAKRKPTEEARHRIMAIAEKSHRARRMSDVQAFRVLPTELASFNRASKCQGVPLSCVILLHGPEAGGKTGLALAFIKAVQAVGGIAAFVDAEMAADTHGWIPRLGVDTTNCIYIGRTEDDPKKKPAPLTYEETVEEVDGLISGFQKKKHEGVIEQGTPLVIVVDSLSKLYPERAMKDISKRGEGKGGDVLSKGIGRQQALLNRGWLASLGPRVGDDDIMFVIIAHEFEGEGGFDLPRIKGGNSMRYDAMMQLRVEFAHKVTDYSNSNEEGDEKAPMTGRAHRVRVMKNKHGPAYDQATFFISNGAGVCPAGFDHVRERIFEAAKRGIVKLDSELNSKTRLTLGKRISFAGKVYTIGNFYDETKLGAQTALTAITTALFERRS